MKEKFTVGPKRRKDAHLKLYKSITVSCLVYGTEARTLGSDDRELESEEESGVCTGLYSEE
jgi:hypothetical protein